MSSPVNDLPSGFVAFETDHRQLIHKLLVSYDQPFVVFREVIQNADDAQAKKVEIHFRSTSQQSDDSSSKKKKVAATAKTTKTSKLTAKSAAASSSSSKSDSSSGASCFSSTSLSSSLQDLTVREILIMNDGVVFTPTCIKRVRTIAQGNPSAAATGMFGVGFFSVFDYTDCPVLISDNQRVDFYIGSSQGGSRVSTLTKSDETEYKQKYGLNTKETFLQLKISGQAKLSVEYEENDAKMGRSMIEDTSEDAESSEDNIRKIPLPNLFSFCAQMLSFAKHIRDLYVYVDGEIVTHMQKKKVDVEKIKLDSSSAVTQDGAILKASKWEESTCEVSATVYEAPTSPSSSVTYTASLNLHEVMASIHMSESARQEMMKALAKNGFMDETKIAIALPMSQKKHQNVLVDVLPWQMKEGIVTKSSIAAKKAAASSSSSSLMSIDEYVSSSFPSSHRIRPLGKVHAGPPTKQPTSGCYHFNAQLYPTIERVNLDLGDSSKGKWNINVLKFVGKCLRQVYEKKCEKAPLPAPAPKTKKAAAAAAASSGNECPADVWNSLSSFLLTGNFSSSEDTHASNRFISAGFVSAPRLRLPVLVNGEKRAVEPSTNAYMPPPALLASLLKLPFVPQELVKHVPRFFESLVGKTVVKSEKSSSSAAAASSASSSMSSLYSQHALATLTADEVRKQLKSRLLTDKEIISVMKFLAQAIALAKVTESAAKKKKGKAASEDDESGSSDQLFKSTDDLTKLLKDISFSVPTHLLLAPPATGKASTVASSSHTPPLGQLVVTLGAMKYFSRFPSTLPLPHDCMPYHLSSRLSSDELEGIFSLTELKHDRWIKSFTSQVEFKNDGTNWYDSYQNAATVLTFLSQQMSSLSNKDATSMISYLKSVPCLPAIEGGYAAAQALGSSISSSWAGKHGVSMYYPEKVHLPGPNGVEVKGILQPAMRVEMELDEHRMYADITERKTNGSGKTKKLAAAAAASSSSRRKRIIDEDEDMEGEHKNGGDDELINLVDSDNDDALSDMTNDYGGNDDRKSSKSAAAASSSSSFSVSVTFLKALSCPPVPVASLLATSSSTPQASSTSSAAALDNARIVSVLMKQSEADVSQFKTEKHLWGCDASDLKEGAAAPSVKHLKYRSVDLVFPSAAAALNYPVGLLVLAWPSSGPTLRPGSMEYEKLRSLGVRSVPDLSYLLAQCANASPDRMCPALAYLVEKFDPEYRREFRSVVDVWDYRWIPCVSVEVAVDTREEPRQVEQWLENKANAAMSSSSTSSSTSGSKRTSGDSAAFSTKSRRGIQEAIAESERSSVSELRSHVETIVKRVGVRPRLKDGYELCGSRECFASSGAGSKRGLNGETKNPLFPTLLPELLAHMKRNGLDASAFLIAERPPLELAMLRMLQWRPPTPSTAGDLFAYLSSLVPANASFGKELKNAGVRFVPVKKESKDGDASDDCTLEPAERVFVVPSGVDLGGSSALFDEDDIDMTEEKKEEPEAVKGKRKRGAKTTSSKRTKTAAASSSSTSLSDPDSLTSKLSSYPGLISFVDFGTHANAFLESMHVVSEPSASQLMACLSANAVGWFAATARDHSTTMAKIITKMKIRLYASCLAMVDEGWKASPKAEKTAMALAAQKGMCLMAYRRTKSDESSDASVAASSSSSSSSSTSKIVLGVIDSHEYALMHPSDICLVDEHRFVNQLNPWVAPEACAPSEEKPLYREAGSPWLSTAITFKAVVGPLVSAGMVDTEDLRQHIQSRLPLLVARNRGEKEVSYSKVQWKKLTSDSFQVRQAKSIVHNVLFQGKPFGTTKNLSSVVIQPSSQVGGSASGLTMCVVNASVGAMDWFDLAEEIAKLVEIPIAERKHISSSWCNILQASDQQLQRRGLIAATDTLALETTKWASSNHTHTELIQDANGTTTGEYESSHSSSHRPDRVKDFGSRVRTGAFESMTTLKQANFNGNTYSAPEQLYEEETYTCECRPSTQLEKVCVDASISALPFFCEAEQKHLVREWHAPLRVFSMLITDLLHHVFAVGGGDKKKPIAGFHLFHDIDSNTVGFNLDRSIFLNLRYFIQVNWRDLMKKKKKNNNKGNRTTAASVASSSGDSLIQWTSISAGWMHTIAHEVAHNTHRNHDQEHENEMCDLLQRAAHSFVTFAAEILPKRIHEYDHAVTEEGSDGEQPSAVAAAASSNNHSSLSSSSSFIDLMDEDE